MENSRTESTKRKIRKMTHLANSIPQVGHLPEFLIGPVFVQDGLSKLSHLGLIIEHYILAVYLDDGRHTRCLVSNDVARWRDLHPGLQFRAAF